MTDLVTPVHRSEFATVQLAADLLKLEEDWLRLSHRASRPGPMHPLDTIEHENLIGEFKFVTHMTREELMGGLIRFDVAIVSMRMLEAAFHVARRALNGLDPDPVPARSRPHDDDEWPAAEEEH